MDSILTKWRQSELNFVFTVSLTESKIRIVLTRWKKQQKDNEKKRSQNFKKRRAEHKANKSAAMVVDDERFKTVDANRFLTKPTKVKKEKETVPGLLKPKFNAKKSKIDKKLIVAGKKNREIKRKI